MTYEERDVLVNIGLRFAMAKVLGDLVRLPQVEYQLLRQELANGCFGWDEELKDIYRDALPWMVAESMPWMPEESRHYAGMRVVVDDVNPTPVYSPIYEGNKES